PLPARLRAHLARRARRPRYFGAARRAPNAPVNSAAMAWFRKRPDPISDRERTLNDEIAELEAEIKKLDSRLQKEPPAPRLRSTAIPQGETVTHNSPEPTPPPRSDPVAHEPIFEDVNQNLLKSKNESASTPQHYNDLGVRKYDLPALFRRLKNQA